jgi:hypothetical protein
VEGELGSRDGSFDDAPRLCTKFVLMQAFGTFSSFGRAASGRGGSSKGFGIDSKVRRRPSLSLTPSLPLPWALGGGAAMAV